MCKLAWGISLILLLLLGAMGYTFIIKGETITASDGRSAIVLAEGERDLVLNEMRSFLQAVQGIISAVETNDMAEVAKQAKSVGLAAQEGVPASLMKKLPIEFKKIGRGTHKAFDQLAMDAADLGDKNQALKQLGELMQRCIACHAVYRIDSEMPQAPKP
ncbi:MAG TPA: hypothetical protein ENJ33_03570 [Thiothrix sp.]|nr:hypothetical protein [Thiothrix sp.]